MANKPRVHILGASHAAKIAHAIHRHSGFNSEFLISNNTQPGATIDSFQIDFQTLVSLKETDFVIINFLGNDLLQKNIRITHHPRTIHLTRFVPKSEQELEDAYSKLKEILSYTRAQVLILDHIYKHVKCCAEHVYPQIQGFWVRKNRELVNVFRRYRVFDHRKMLPHDWTKLKNMEFYSTLFVDSVHLYPMYYVCIADCFFNVIKHNQ